MARSLKDLVFLGEDSQRNSPQIVKNYSDSKLYFPNFVERSIMNLPFSKLCAVHFALQNLALFEGEKRAKRCRQKWRKRGGQKRGQKGKKGRVKTGQHIRKSVVSIKFPPVILGPEMAAPILPVDQKLLHIKFRKKKIQSLM